LDHLMIGLALLLSMLTIQCHLDFLRPVPVQKLAF
jgi:hypothetical protein